MEPVLGRREATLQSGSPLSQKAQRRLICWQQLARARLLSFA